MKNHFISLLALCITMNTALAQNNRYQLGDGKKVTIDTCILSVDYRFTFYPDTTKSTPFHDKKRLEIGTIHSRYSSVYATKVDSLAEEKSKTGIQSYNVAKELGLGKDQSPGWEDVYFHYPTENRITVSALIAQYEYYYEEPLEKMNWVYENEQKEWLGYTCTKVTTWFKGRKYEAWVTPEIPARIGPWKFNNLPGLLLVAYDTEGYFTWEAVSLLQPKKQPIYFKQGKTVTHCSKKEYVKIRQMTWEDPVQLYLSQGIRIQIKSGNSLVERKMGDIVLPPIPQLEINY